MSESLTLERARRYIAHLDSGGDPEDLDAFLADDFVQVEFPNQLTPGGVLPPSTVVVSPLSPSNEGAYATFPQRERLSVQQSTISACTVGT